MIRPTQDKNALLTNEELELIYNKCVEDNYLNNFAFEVAKAQIEKLERLGYHLGLPDSISEALNSGDGVYRP